jgi:L-ascorbate metabolism protein UlaG (beta-lactamase superfamily)
MGEKSYLRMGFLIVGALLFLATAGDVWAAAKKTAPSTKAPALCSQEACKSWIPACIGGPVPAGPDLAVIRWLGNSNYEVSHQGQVILVDNFYKRGSRAPFVGFTPDQVKRADAIFVTHGHKDHMSDTAQVALQTKAPVYGHQHVLDKLLTQNVPSEQLHAFTGLESFRFKGFKVQMVHIYHNIGAKTLYRDAINDFTKPTPAQLAEEKEINDRGSNWPGIVEEGLFAFLFTFDSGFTFLAGESAAHPKGWTDQILTVVKEHNHRFDVVGIPYQAGYAPLTDMPAKAWPFVQLTNPRLAIPLHHDVFPDFPMSPTEPLAQKIKEEKPATAFYSPLYREPLCFNVRTSRQGRLMPLCPTR